MSTSAIDEALKNVTTWQRGHDRKRGCDYKWLHFTRVDGALIGAVLATCKQGDADFRLRDELRRAEAEIQRLTEAKRRALLIADERSKEIVELRREIERLWAALEGEVSGSRCVC